MIVLLVVVVRILLITLWIVLLVVVVRILSITLLITLLITLWIVLSGGDTRSEGSEDSLRGWYI